MKFQIGSMTVGDILDRGLKILLSRLGVFYAINLLVLAPLVLIQIALPAIIINANSPVLTLLLALFAIVLLLILQPIGSAAMLRVITQEYVDRPVTFGEAMQFAMSRFGTLLGTSILAGLIIFVGLLCLIVPGIIFMLNYALIAQVVVVEGLGGMAALERSKKLTEGWRGRIFGVLFLIFLINIAFSLVLSQLNHVLPSITLVRDSTGVMQPQFHFVNSVIRTLVEQLVAILFSTYGAICTTLIYFDLRARKEGYDLELAARGEATPAQEI